MQLTVLALDRAAESAEGLALVKKQVSDLLAEASAPSQLGSRAIASKLAARWAAVPSEARPLLNKEQQRSLFVIESAYSQLLQQADVFFAQLRRRVEAGKRVAQFPQRVRELLSSLLAEFSAAVAGTSAVRERIERLSNLRAFVQTSAARLFQQQLLQLDFEHARRFRRDVAALHASFRGSEDAAASAEAMQAAVRKAVFDYQAAGSALEDEALGLLVSQEQLEDFSKKLQAVAKEYPESAEAKLEEVRRLERQVQQQKPRRKRRGQRAFGVSLNLVGMLRPPGYGNLQGFIGYATSLLGLPLDLLLGVQNDGDSPEILGEDREHPLLRLQPKVHFDVDL